MSTSDCSAPRMSNSSRTSLWASTITTRSLPNLVQRQPSRTPAGNATRPSALVRRRHRPARSCSRPLRASREAAVCRPEWTMGGRQGKRARDRIEAEAAPDLIAGAITTDGAHRPARRALVCLRYGKVVRCRQPSEPASASPWRVPRLSTGRIGFQPRRQAPNQTAPSPPHVRQTLFGLPPQPVQSAIGMVGL
jgi:hypothetical protein